MMGIERRQFEMLRRVSDYGATHQGLFEASPVAQQTFAAVTAAVAELGTVDEAKQRASGKARAVRRSQARKALIELLQRVAELARHLEAGGQTLPPFLLPNSKSAQELITAGRRFAEDVAPFEADFGGHSMGAAQIAKVTATFEAAVQEQGKSRTGHVEARTRIQQLLVAAIRDTRRLDLIVANDLDAVAQQAWKQLRRVEDPRTARAGADPKVPVPPDDATGKPLVEADLQVVQPKEADHAAGA